MKHLISHVSVFALLDSAIFSQLFVCDCIRVCVCVCVCICVCMYVCALWTVLPAVCLENPQFLSSISPTLLDVKQQSHKIWLINPAHREKQKTLFMPWPVIIFPSTFWNCSQVRQQATRFGQAHVVCIQFCPYLVSFVWILFRCNCPTKIYCSVGRIAILEVIPPFPPFLDTSLYIYIHT
jgi:hypothetical protein